ncbi:hypothetical protein RA8CHR_01501 [Variovorax sp. RA8]|nr:hypothetical protein RA8CHR_01501 [Variovorax sp. RA8]
MLRISVLFVVASCFLLGLESYRGEQLQARRTAEQRELLARLESIGRASVSQLVADWRLAYSEPNEYQLEELRGLVAQLQSDPGALESRP